MSGCGATSAIRIINFTIYLRLLLKIRKTKCDSPVLLAPTTASRVETSLIEQQEEEVRPTCVAHANEVFVSVANLQKM